MTNFYVPDSYLMVIFPQLQYYFDDWPRNLWIKNIRLISVCVLGDRSVKVAKFWMSFYFWLACLTAAIIQEHLDNNSILDNLDQSTKDSPTTVVTLPSPGCKHKPLPSLGRRKQQVLIGVAWSFLPRCFWWLVSHPGMFSVAVHCASAPPVHYPVSGV